MSEEQTNAEAVESPETSNEGASVSLSEETAETVTPEASDEPVSKVALQSDETEQSETPETEQPKSRAPESYEDFSVPEGAASFDSDVVESFSQAAKAADLSQDDAQALLDSVAPKIMERTLAQHQATIKEWAEQSVNDPEFGGSKLDESMATAKLAYKETTSAEFRELMKATGLEVHPEVIRHFHGIGKNLSADKFEAEGEHVAQVDWNDPHKAAEVLFPTSVGKQR